MIDARISTKVCHLQVYMYAFQIHVCEGVCMYENACEYIHVHARQSLKMIAHQVLLTQALDQLRHHS